METDLIQVVTCSICISVNRFSRVRVTIFFIYCYLTVPRPNLGHYRGESLTQPILITATWRFGPEGHLATKLGP